MRYYLEFGGGLGDVFNQMYHRRRYNVLRDLEPDDTATVALITHNPFVKELFEWHPKRSQTEVIECGYWNGPDDAVHRRKWNLPPAGANGRLPIKDGDIEFHVGPGEQAQLDGLIGGLRKFVVMAASAGLPERNLPDEIFTDVTRAVGEKFPVVLVGRTYERHGRREIRLPQKHANVVDAVDRFSVPGVAKLLQAAAGLVTCHSALNILGWHLRKPQLLLYPESVRLRHIRFRDEWSFGAGFPETIHSTFDKYSPALTQHFLHLL